jgi:MoxR-like ATPase
MNKKYSLNDLAAIAREVIAIAEHRTLLFRGEMGVGKTTLIKEICNILGRRGEKKKFFALRHNTLRPYKPKRKMNNISLK